MSEFTLLYPTEYAPITLSSMSPPPTELLKIFSVSIAVVVVGVVVTVVLVAVLGTGGGPRYIVFTGPGFHGGKVSCK